MKKQIDWNDVPIEKITHITVDRVEYRRLQQERDELLAACKAMSKVTSMARADKVDWGAFWAAANQIDAAIDKMRDERAS